MDFDLILNTVVGNIIGGFILSGLLGGGQYLWLKFWVRKLLSLARTRMWEIDPNSPTLARTFAERALQLDPNNIEALELLNSGH